MEFTAAVALALAPRGRNWEDALVDRREARRKAFIGSFVQALPTEAVVGTLSKDLIGGQTWELECKV